MSPFYQFEKQTSSKQVSEEKAVIITIVINEKTGLHM